MFYFNDLSMFGVDDLSMFGVGDMSMLGFGDMFGVGFGDMFGVGVGDMFMFCFVVFIVEMRIRMISSKSCFKETKNFSSKVPALCNTTNQ